MNPKTKTSFPHGEKERERDSPKLRSNWSKNTETLELSGFTPSRRRLGGVEVERRRWRIGDEWSRAVDWTQRRRDRRVAWGVRLECMILDLGLKDPKRQTWKRKTVKGNGGFFFFFLIIIYNPVPGSRFNRVFWNHQPGTGTGLPGFKKSGTYPGPIFRIRLVSVPVPVPVITGPDFHPYG